MQDSASEKMLRKLTAANLINLISDFCNNRLFSSKCEHLITSAVYMLLTEDEKKAGRKKKRKTEIG